MTFILSIRTKMSDRAVLQKQRSSLLNYDPGFFKGVSFDQVDGRGLRVAIVYARWNAEIVSPLVDKCVSELLECGVSEDDIIRQHVPGSYELPYGASRVIHSQRLDAIICIGCLIKGETMHFEYIAEAVSHGIMKVQLDSGVPVVFGVLTCLTEDQARSRAGLKTSDGKEGKNHGGDWARTAVEMAQLRKCTGSF